MTDSPTTILTSVSTQTSSYVSTSPPKRKRRPAGTPDPDAEVIALSPKMLMESDRYVCEICNQGFQRDQNLQMHRRRHKVPWKLLKRADPEVRKRVYVCPEPTCLHHSPCHALGDLVGIKKHYRRKHSSMKQWECDKCFKAYAVQSDYKAHLKTCGTRGHCCDCGRVFSRVESFIEHQDACTAASSKKGAAPSIISDHQQATSLPSHAASPVDHHHAPLMPTIPPASAAEKVIQKDDYHPTYLMNFPLANVEHECRIVSAHPPLPPRRTQHACAPPAQCPMAVTSAHLCGIPIPATSDHHRSAAPGFILASVPPPDAVHAKVSWGTKQADVTHHLAELQLLPAKPPSSQLESSQSSNVCTWGKDITPTNSSVSATVCSSPYENMDHEKQALKNLGTTCKLQLSIGFVHDDHHSTCSNENSMSSLQVSSQLLAPRHEATDAIEVPDSRTTNIVPWLTWSAFPATGQQRHNGTLSKRQCSSVRALIEKEEGININCSENDTIYLELATGGNTLHQTSSLDLQKEQDQDTSCKGRSAASRVLVSAALGYADVESMKMDEENQKVDSDEKLLLGSNPNLPSAKLLCCSSLSRPMVDVELNPRGHEAQPNSPLSVAIAANESSNEESAASPLEPKQPNFSLGTERAPSIAAAELAHVGESRLRKAKEKLKMALAEKLEAERAWEEARREVDQAEAEVAGVSRQLTRDYSSDVQAPWKAAASQHHKELEARKPPHNSSSASSSVASSSSSYQVISPSSPVQMQLNAGGVIISNAPSFITCPACHHTQILYHPANLRGTLFLPSYQAPAHHNTTATSTTTTTTTTTILEL